MLPFLTLSMRAALAGALETLAGYRGEALYPGLTVEQTALLLLVMALRGRREGMERFMEDCQLIPAIKRYYDGQPAAPELVRRYDALQAALRGADGARVKAHLDARFFSV